jgi:endoglucanase
VHELFIDVGAESADDVAELGLRVGHPLVFPVEVTRLRTHRITGRAIDNRVGGYIVARVLAHLAEKRPACTVHVTNTVLEEQGGKGADMLAHRLDPDVAVCFDVAHANDSPGIDPRKHGHKTLGGGPIVSHGGSNHPHVARRLLDVAAAEDIATQHRASGRRSGTNTDHIFRQRRGIPSGLVSIPLRYMHSPVETADLRDVAATIALLTAFARSLTPGDTFHAFGAR